MRVGRRGDVEKTKSNPKSVGGRKEIGENVLWSEKKSRARAG